MIDGHKVRVWRTIRGLSQDELAYLSGMEPHTLSRIEKGHTENCDITTAEKLAYGLRTSIDSLCTMDPGMLEGIEDRREGNSCAEMGRPLMRTMEKDLRNDPAFLMSVGEIYYEADGEKQGIVRTVLNIPEPRN